MKRLPTPPPTSGGHPLTITIPCHEDGPHPVTINPDWRVETPHDLEADRVGVAFGAALPCSVAWVDHVVPAFKSYVEANARVTPLSGLVAREPNYRADAPYLGWRPVEPHGCCLGSVSLRESLPELVSHLRSPDHWASALRASLTEPLDCLCFLDALDRLVEASGYSPIWLPEPELVTQAQETLRQGSSVARLWALGIHPQAVLDASHEEIGFALVPTLSEAIMCALESGSTQIELIASAWYGGCRSKDLDWLAWQLPMLWRFAHEQVCGWASLGLQHSVTLLGIRSGADHHLVRRGARGLVGKDVERVAEWVALWTLAGCNLTPADVRRVRDVGKLHVRPADVCLAELWEACQQLEPVPNKTAVAMRAVLADRSARFLLDAARAGRRVA